MGAAMLWPKVERKTSGCDAKPPSARAQAIAKSHEEMLGLLRNLPESDYELSFTDLVERRPAAVDGEGVLAIDKASAAGEASAGHDVEKVKGRKVRRSYSERKTGGGGSGSGSGSGRGGVLLNVYVPSSFTRSLTESRSRQGLSNRVQDDRNERQRHLFGCWSAIWERAGRGKPRGAMKQQPTG